MRLNASADAPIGGQSLRIGGSARAAFLFVPRQHNHFVYNFLNAQTFPPA